MANSGSLPPWIDEMDVQTFVPASDTNAEQIFTISLTKTPDLVIVLSDLTERVSGRDFGGFVSMKALNNLEMNSAFDGSWAGFAFYTQASGEFVRSQCISNTTNPAGVVTASSTSVTIRTSYYGGQYTYFRAGHKYTIIAMNTKP